MFDEISALALSSGKCYMSFSLGKRDVRIGTLIALSVWEYFLQSNQLPVDVPVVQSIFTRTQLSFSEVEITFAEFNTRSSHDVALSIFCRTLSEGNTKHPLPQCNSEMHAPL